MSDLEVRPVAATVPGQRASSDEVGATTAERLEALERSVATASEALSLRGQEIDAIQVEQAKKARPFYREPATLVAILALLGSLVATYLSSSNDNLSRASTAEGRLIDQRSRLTSLIQDIADWRGESSPAIAGGRPALDEAYFLVGVLQGTRYRATSLDKQTMADGYLYANEPRRAVELAQQAETESAASPMLEDKALSTDTLATAFFDSDRPVEARAAFEREIQYLDSLQGYSKNIKMQRELEALRVWSQREIAYSCPEAQRRVDQARQVLPKMSPDGAASWSTNIQGMQDLVSRSCK